MRVLALWLAGAAALGCDSFAETPKQTYDNTGSVCLALASGTLLVEVRFPTCLSSSCDRALETSCQAVVSDRVITVTSRGASEATGESSCTDDCGALVANCSLLSNLTPGDYTVKHGTDLGPITLGATQACVFGP